MPGDKNFNKTLLANHYMSKRVVQWQLSVSFWYVPDSEQKQITDCFFIRMGKMFKKLFNYFYWGCHVVEDTTRQMMVELDRIRIHYNEQTVRKKRRINKLLGRFELFCYLKVTEKELNSKCVSIANYLEVNQVQVVWWSQSYVAWRKNNKRMSPMRAQVPEVEETTDMDDFEEINQDGDNLVEISIDIPGPE